MPTVTIPLDPTMTPEERGCLKDALGECIRIITRTDGPVAVDCVTAD